VISSAERAPMLGVLADVLSRFVPEQRDLLHLSFVLADANRLEHMFRSAGFREIRVDRVQREDTIGSLDEHWDPIETGMGSQPQIYVALPAAERQAVREQVNSRLIRFVFRRTSYDECRDADRGRTSITTTAADFRTTKNGPASTLCGQFALDFCTS
jgi:hypothetical protein